MFYYFGWFIIFLCILYITHLLSKHIRFILLSFIKVVIAGSITLTLALLVYIVEHLDQQKIQEAIQNAYSKMEEFRNAQL
tara:strand:+ start:3736 stop:3975 length:240 start_codon:yes stop_codon:yes gene_type:complete